MSNNYVVNDANSNRVTFRSLDLGDGTEISQSVPSDSTGTPFSSGNPLPTVPAQASSIATGQVTVGTSATLICAARTGRRAVTVIQEGATLVRLGASGVTTGNGVPLPATQYASFTFEGGAAVYGIVGSGTQLVSYVETF